LESLLPPKQTLAPVTLDAEKVHIYDRATCLRKMD